MLRILNRLLLVSVVALITGCAGSPPRAPESTAIASVAAANPYAVEAGLSVLRAGGSAVDAAVAVQAMLSLVEPQSSGIGGGGFLMHYNAASHRVTAFDGREMAPLGATPDMFMGADGKPLAYRDAVISGRATGTPGALAMLGSAHALHGKLPWQQLFGAAITAAEDGFIVPQRLARFRNLTTFPQSQQPDVVALLSRADSSPVQAGDILMNPAYAATLRTVAARGPRALLEGPIAEAIIARTHGEPLPGTLTMADLASYQPRVADAICGPFLVYLVCVPPPPSSGVSLLQLLAMLERTDIARRSAADPQAWFLLAEASRLMYADRDRYIADPAFIDVPLQQLLDAGYVASRAALIGERAGPAPAAGELSVSRGRDATDEPAGTSHFVISDAAGNVVSMTTSVESLFGSGRVVGGFLLNNQLTDFSYVPVESGQPVANAVAGHKRPRSSMTPVIVLDQQGKLVAALGSPGGTAILAYNAKTLLGVLAWGMSMQEAIDLPNLIARGNDFFGEVSKFSPELLQALAERGVTVKSGRGEESGLHGIMIRSNGKLEGGADMRREGTWRPSEGEQQ